MLDAESALRTTVVPGMSAAEASLTFCRDMGAVAAAAVASTANVDPLPVTGNHGRWIVECPDGDGGAQFASRGDPRFMCIECMNVAIGGLWRPVVWPVEVVELEAVLDARPAEESRNWVPGQTVEDLIAEDEPELEAADSQPVEVEPAEIEPAAPDPEEG